jgi:hypothetical protein
VRARDQQQDALDELLQSRILLADLLQQRVSFQFVHDAVPRRSPIAPLQRFHRRHEPAKISPGCGHNCKQVAQFPSLRRILPLPQGLRSLSVHST